VCDLGCAPGGGGGGGPTGWRGVWGGLRGGGGGGGQIEKRGRVSSFLRVLLTGFGEPSNLEYGWEHRRLRPERSFATVDFEWRILYNGGCKTIGGRGVGQVLTRGRAAGWIHAALDSCAGGPGGGCAGAAEGGGEQGGEE